jgi:uncharacterized membrane-anchored protein
LPIFLLTYLVDFLKITTATSNKHPVIRDTCVEFGGRAMFRLRLFCAVTTLCLVAHTADAQTANTNDVWKELNKLDWQFNGIGRIGSEANIQIPANYAFLGSAGTRRFLELNGNLPKDNAFLIGPKDLGWFGVFQFDDSGYVPDDEKLDPDALLDTLKEHNRAQQAEMKRRGLDPLYLQGWFVEPHYDLTTKRLEWGVRLTTERGDPVVNYAIKLLGRRGVMNATLVSNPQSFGQDTRQFKGLLQSYSFNPGERYSEFRSGDKIAEYGLSALIIGGAAAAAAKTGLFKYVAKFIGIGVIAILAAIGSFFKRIFRRSAA